jgi:tRNA pseudouridine55 synthase
MARSRRGKSGLSFLFSINKPISFTSHDVVNVARKATSERRVGHGGTLDPFASGVLPIMVGPATRLSNYFKVCKKEYVAQIKFGTATDTDDLTGNVIATKSIDEQLFDCEFANRILSNFVGDIEQIPPKYSAIKVGGKKAYELARGGSEVNIPKRKVTVFDAKLLSIFEEKEDGSPIWEIRFLVSSGTYIRSLARDIGTYANSIAHVYKLQRTRVGEISIEDCADIDDLKDQFELEKFIIDPVKVLPFSFIQVSLEEEKLVACGNFLKLAGKEDYIKSSRDDLFFVGNMEKVLAIYKFDESENKLKAETVFSKGILR